MGVLGFRIVQSIMCASGNFPWAEAMTVLCGDIKRTDLEWIVGKMVFGYSWLVEHDACDTRTDRTGDF